jgi:hypothetical protein
LLIACSIPGAGGAQLVSQLLLQGAKAATGISLHQYLLHRRLRQRFLRKSTSITPDSGSCNFSPNFEPGQLGSPATSPLSRGSFRTPSILNYNEPANARGFAIGRSPTQAEPSAPKLYSDSTSPKAQADKGSFPILQGMGSFENWMKGKYIFPIDIAAACENMDVVKALLPKLDVIRIKDAQFCFLLQQNLGITLQLFKSGADAMQRDWGYDSNAVFVCK